MLQAVGDATNTNIYVMERWQVSAPAYINKWSVRIN